MSSGQRNHRFTWGMRAECDRAEGMVVFPPRSLVQNIGQDGTGTHGRALLRNFRGRPMEPGSACRPVDARAAMLGRDEWKSVQQAIWRQNGGWLGSAVDLAKRIIRR